MHWADKVIENNDKEITRYIVLRSTSWEEAGYLSVCNLGKILLTAPTDFLTILSKLLLVVCVLSHIVISVQNVIYMRVHHSSLGCEDAHAQISRGKSSFPRTVANDNSSCNIYFHIEKGMLYRWTFPFYRSLIRKGLQFVTPYRKVEQDTFGHQPGGFKGEVCLLCINKLNWTLNLRFIHRLLINSGLDFRPAEYEYFASMLLLLNVNYFASKVGCR